jgi:hypothetical protein
MHHRRVLLTIVAALATLVLVVPAASAHEERQVGPLTFLVGFTPEPAVAGQPIAVEMDITRGTDRVILTDKQLKNVAVHLFAGKLAGAKPVDADYKTLPNQPMPLHATPWIAPGHYETESFIPTSTTTYTVHVASKPGALPNGFQLNEVFVSGPDTFGPVENPTDMQFPVKVPTNIELAQANKTSAEDMAAIDDKITDLQNLADTARVVMIGLAVGLALALCLSLLTLLRGHRHGSPVPDTPAGIDEVARR